jgi:hypothetical protein
LSHFAKAGFHPGFREGGHFPEKLGGDVLQDRTVCANRVWAVSA